MPRGKFIVIEGGDGAGKDTQLVRLKKRFGKKNFVYTRDPGGTALGRKLRHVLQYGGDMAKESELFLLLAARAQAAYEVIEPALAAGKNVISNRFDFSTHAYQIYGRDRQANGNLIRAMSVFARRNAVPDLVVVLDVPPLLGLARSKKRAQKVTRFEKEALAFHTRVRTGYLKSARYFHKVKIIDASREAADVWKDVEKAVNAVL